MFDCLDKKATQAGFARLVGTTKQAISERVKAGQLPAEGTYSEWLAAYLSRLRDEAAGRSEKELAAIRGRKELAQAMREELAFASDLKMIVLKDDIRPGLIGILKEIQSSVLQTARRSAHAIQSEHKIKLHDGILLEPLRTALRDIGTSADQLVATLEGKPSGAVSSAIAADQGLDRTKLPASSGE